MSPPPQALPHPIARPWRALLAFACLLASSVLFVAVLPAGAQGGFPPPQFWDRCDSAQPAGERCGNPRGVAANPQNGRVYVADQDGRRVIEYTAWGELVRMWGWDVVASGDGDTAEDEFEVCVPADGDVCKPGTQGGGAGQFSIVNGVAVDSAGNVYVWDKTGNRRVQKFSPEGEFLRTWGRDVNSGTSGNPDLCTNAGPPTDVCQGGTSGSDPGQFSTDAVGSYIAVGPNDEIYVGDVGRIQRFDTDGTYQDEFATPDDHTVKALAVAPSGDLYVALCQGFSGCSHGGAPLADVRRLSPSGTPLATIPADRPIALATDPGGNLYVSVDRRPTGTGAGVFHPAEIRRYSPAGALLDTHVDDGFFSSFGLAVSPVTAAGDLALYLTSTVSAPNAFVRAYSPVPDPDIVGPAPPAAPTVSEFVDSVGVSDATIGAGINPRFWDDATYYAEYGSEGPCESSPCEQVGLPGIALDSGVSDSAKLARVVLGGLEPKTTYHFRFVAESGGGGPTFGEGGTFTTFATNPPRTDCPNQAFRSGPSARLPDCRAYEMVSPVDKNGGDAKAVLSGEVGGDATPDMIVEAAHFRASPDGKKVSYASATAFGDAKAGAYSTQYLASRSDGGWTSTGLNPASANPIPGDFLPTLHSHFDTFSEDMSIAYHNHFADPQPDPAAPESYKNLYRRNPDGTYTALTTVTPPTALPGTGDGGFDPRFGGFSADGATVVYSANDRLAPGASTATAGANDEPIHQTYEHRDGEALRLVSVLPGGSASDESSVVGGGRRYRKGAVSADGQRIYWTTGTPPPTVAAYRPPSPLQGRIYVRVGGQTTIPVSGPVSGARAQFWAAAEDGSAALFSIVESESPLHGNLYRFDLATQSSTLIATGLTDSAGNTGAVGAADLSRAYLQSRSVLDPEPNSRGESAVAGQINIYLWEQGEGLRFVATPDGASRSGEGQPFGIAPNRPTRRLAHASPDGRHLLFVARNSLTGYDTTDASSGRTNLHVYRYAAEADELHCLSCNPSGARSRGGEVGPFPEIAAWLPGWRQGSLYQQRAISDDGGRAYFQSFDDILPADINGKADVYQWQAPGTGDCTVEHPNYFASNGGCLDLISTGRSQADSEFIEATPDGETVFIRTAQSLLAHDPGQLDIYAARVGGGLPAPAAPPEPCEGDACQPPPEPPEDQTPASADFEGAGNQRPAADCAILARRAQRSARRARTQRQRAKKLRQRAKRQARRGAARRAKRARQRAGRVGRRARSTRQQAKRLRAETRACRDEQPEERSGR